MASRWLGMGEIFFIIHIRRNIAHQQLDLKLLHSISKIKYPYENNSNIINTVSSSH